MRNENGFRLRETVAGSVDKRFDPGGGGKGGDDSGTAGVDDPLYHQFSNVQTGHVERRACPVAEDLLDQRLIDAGIFPSAQQMGELSFQIAKAADGGDGLRGDCCSGCTGDAEGQSGDEQEIQHDVGDDGNREEQQRQFRRTHGT